MSAKPPFDTNLATAALIFLVSTLALWGCASRSTPHGSADYSHPLSTVSLVQQTLSVAVLLEDQCESQENDDRTVTLLEALYDGFVIPNQALFLIGAITVVGTVWSLYDRFTLPAGVPLPDRPHMVMNYAWPSMASPRLSSGPSSSRDTPIAWSACSNYLGNR